MEDISRQDFEAYLRVQEEGLYNMLSEGARIASGLSEETYYTIIKYYGELKQMYDNNELLYK